ncbi:unnamed protein product [Closterium sp. Naga37s-1]|nr:unnamed protein product [Closterium sp. Naga37s-1]
MPSTSLLPGLINWRKSPILSFSLSLTRSLQNILSVHARLPLDFRFDFLLTALPRYPVQSTVIHRGPLGTARTGLQSAHALFSGTPGSSLQPYSFSHTSFRPLSDGHKQLVQQLRLWAHGFPFLIRPPTAPEPLLTISSIDADIAFDLCVQVWHIVKRDRMVVLFVWDGTDLPLPSLSAHVHHPSLDPAPLVLPSLTHPLARAPLHFVPLPRSTALNHSISLLLSLFCAGRQHQSPPVIPRITASHTMPPNPPLHHLRPPAHPYPNPHPLGHPHQPLHQHRRMQGCIPPLLLPALAQGTHFFAVGGRPAPPLCVLQRVPPLGSLLPVMCHVDDLHWLLHRLHPSVAKALEGEGGGGPARAGHEGEGGGRGDGGNRGGENERAERDQNGGQGAGGVAAEGSERRQDGEGREEGEEERVAGEWQQEGVVPCWVRLRNIRATCHGARGDWLGIFNNSSRLSLVRECYSDVAELKSKYAERAASEDAHTRIGNMALWASIHQHTRIARSLQPYSTLRQIYTHPVVPYRFRCAARVIFASAIHPARFTAFVPDKPRSISSSPAPPRSSTPLPAVATSAGAAAGTDATEGTGEEGTGKRSGEEGVERARAKLQKGEGHADVARQDVADVARQEGADVAPQEDAEANVAREAVGKGVEEGEGGGSGKAAETAGTSEGVGGVASAKGESTGKAGSGVKRKWAAGLVLVLEDATGRLLVRLASPNAEVFFSATAEELRKDAGVSARAAASMAMLLGVPRDHGQDTEFDFGQQAHAGIERDAVHENEDARVEREARNPPSIDCSMAPRVLGLLALIAISVVGCVAFSEERPTDQRILVLLDDLKNKDSYSIFFKNLADRGYELDLRAARDSSLVLQKYGEYLYDAAIILAPKVSSFGGVVDVAAILDFVDSGHDLILAADSGASDTIRDIALECGVDLDENPKGVVIDHQQYARVSGRRDDHTLVLGSNLINSSVILGASPIKGPILFQGIAMTVSPTSELVVPVLSGSPTAYAADPAAALKEPPALQGKAVSLVAAMQARNNARVLISGSLALFTDSFFRAVVDVSATSADPASQNAKTSQWLSPAGNEQFVTELSKWTFHERGHLKAVNLRHNKAGESTEPAVYLVSDHLEFAVDIYEWAGSEWVPFKGDDVQVQFYMMSPYVLKTLSHDDKGRFFTSFQVPDVYGVFQFKVEHKRLGYSTISLAKQIPVRPFRHDEFERFIPAAFPYYASTFSMCSNAPFSFTMLVIPPLIILHHFYPTTTLFISTPYALANRALPSLPLVPIYISFNHQMIAFFVIGFVFLYHK